jgi:photosystem II stability/assembly factor-like uncharacterized protein
MKIHIFFLLLCITIFSCGLEPSIESGWRLQRGKVDDITYYAIQFTDENNGWIVGYSGTIKKSSNGGETWISQKSDVQSNLWDVCFINNQIGWICGADNTLLKTIDGGMTWTKIVLSDSTDIVNVAIQFIDTNNGWLSNNQGEILKSSDGGLNWQIVKNNNRGGARLAVFDENTVYILRGNLFRTFNGGLAWDSLQVSTPKNYAKYEMFFPNPSHGYITTVNGTGGMIITEYPIMITKDGGNNWQTSSYLKTESIGFNCVFFVDENNGWIAGNYIYKTTDGGEKWIIDHSIREGVLHAKDMYFINENNGWVLDWDGQVYKFQNN